ncbi:MAG TPA: isoamylase early set domain-containing protein [Gemmatimonadaceae bacterium]|jgi:hypothetical protein
MSDETGARDDVLGERLGRVLRAHERFSDDFERELIEAIRSDVSVERRAQQPRPIAPSWWRTPIPLRLSPLAGVALAASLAAVAVLSQGLGRARVSPDPVTVQPAEVANVVHDTVHVVRFVFVGDARTVSLVGDFNGWRAEATPLAPAGSKRAWVVSLPLAPGRYEYAFIVDGKRWVADPYAPTRADDFDTDSSILSVGT